MTLNAKSDYLETAMVNAVIRGVAWTSPATLYVALFTVLPGESGGGTEVSGGSYARVAVTSSTGWTAPAQAGGFAESSNVADIAFAVATADWGTVVGVALFDASTSGNMLYFGPLTISKVVNNTDQFKFLAGALTIGEA